jgi:hypothetical protein
MFFLEEPKGKGGSGFDGILTSTGNEKNWGMACTARKSLIRGLSEQNGLSP